MLRDVRSEHGTSLPVNMGLRIGLAEIDWNVHGDAEIITMTALTAGWHGMRTPAACAGSVEAGNIGFQGVQGLAAGPHC
jgi:hypothetical protein